MDVTITVDVKLENTVQRVIGLGRRILLSTMEMLRMDCGQPATTR